MKYSEITTKEIKEYSNAYDEDIPMLEIILKAAKSFVKSYTGLTELELDNHEDISIVIFILCNEMFDNRSYSVSNDKANKVATTILDMYSVNLM